MRIIKHLTDNKFINIKEINDPDNHVNGYQFAERLGVDSVAFICYDEKTNEVLLNTEYKPPLNIFILGAFGGSLDKDKVPRDIVITEVKEEAGFSVNISDIYSLGKVMVSTQMNQFCHLYIVKVDKTNQQEREPENKVEAMASTSWHSLDKIGELIDKLEDWKPITIIEKAKSRGIRAFIN